MDNAVAVRVDTGLFELVADQLSGSIGLFERADDLGQGLQTLLIAYVHTEGGMPVIVGRGGTAARPGTRLTRIHDEYQTKQRHYGDDNGE